MQAHNVRQPQKVWKFNAVCDLEVHMGSETLTERVRARLIELHRAGRFRQTAVAARLGKDASAANKTLTSDKAITLEELEAFADEAQVNAAELLAPPGTIKQLNPAEAELLRYVRMWPVDVREALLAFLRYFADESPAETQTRNVHQYWRGMKHSDKTWVYGLLQMVREGILTPDLREGLLDRLTNDLRKPRGNDERRRRKRGDDET